MPHLAQAGRAALSTRTVAPTCSLLDSRSEVLAGTRSGLQMASTGKQSPAMLGASKAASALVAPEAARGAQRLFIS